jgi:hypothetical protein
MLMVIHTSMTVSYLLTRTVGCNPETKLNGLGDVNGNNIRHNGVLHIDNNTNNGTDFLTKNSEVKLENNIKTEREDTGGQTTTPSTGIFVWTSYDQGNNTCVLL